MGSGKRSLSKVWLVTSALSILALGVACSSSATAVPTSIPAPTVPREATIPTHPATSPTPAQAGATAAPTVAPAITSLPTGIVSARDQITVAIPEEPGVVDLFRSSGATFENDVKFTMAEPLTWQSGDDLRIVPTTASESWEQVAPDKWRFELRKGVKFHNGEDWNAQAALPSLEFQAITANASSSSQYTGEFTAEVVGEHTVEITCVCPIFPRTTFRMLFSAPDYLASASEDEFTRRAVSFGPYKQVEWDSGASITAEAYDDYVPAGDHFELQKALIRNVTWVWRNEPSVLAGMINAGEADLAYDVGVDSLGILQEDQIKYGSQADIYFFWTDTIWDQELKKTKVRQAIAHAINCQELVDSLFGGFPPCIGNIIWPGSTGATERNTAPYEFDPALARQLLEEANYDPNNLIRITGPATAVPKQTEIFEAIHGYLNDVGMNVEINLVEASINASLARCRIGVAVGEELEAQGKDPTVDEPTLADMQAAIDKGSANCPSAHFQNWGGYSAFTLDFQKAALDALDCRRERALVCDPSPGGIQEQIGPALDATGEERQRLMEALADRLHDDVLLLGLFDIPIFYGVDPKLNWTPRYDMRVLVSPMWFSP